MSRYKDQKSVRLPSDKESIGHHKVVRIRSSFRAHGQYEPLTTSWPGWHMVLATIVGFSPAMLAAERATAYRELARAMTPGVTRLWQLPGNPLIRGPEDLQPQTPQLAQRERLPGVHQPRTGASIRGTPAGLLWGRCSCGGVRAMTDRVSDGSSPGPPLCG